MKKWTILLIAFCALSVNYSFGQDGKMVESVAHRDGSLFKGFTVGEGDDFINFKLASTGDTLYIQKLFIKDWKSEENHFLFKGNRSHKKDGNFNSFRFNFGADEFDATAQFEFIRGKLITPRLGIGLGVGYNASTANSVTWDILQFGEVFAYSRYYLNDNRRRLFLDAKLGASLPLASSPWLSYTAGPMMQLGIGFEFASNKKTKWSVRLSQFMQYSEIRPSVDNFNFQNFGFSEIISVVDKRLMNRTMLGIGINF